MKSFLAKHRSNLLTSLVLMSLIAFLASRRSGSWPMSPVAGPKSAPDGATLQVAVDAPPLPPHFPSTDDVGTEAKETDKMQRTFAATVKRCWPEIEDKPETATGFVDFSLVDFSRIESFFGRIKYQEAIEASRVGLLFDTSVFSTGAAGSATEKNGKIKELRLRAGGRNLSCIENKTTRDDNESQLECDCF